KDVPWEIAPIHVTTAWMPKAHFDHSKHRTSECKECHAAEKSTKSADVLMPDITTCRKCHAGGTPMPERVTSTCISCHDFHLASGTGRPRALREPQTPKQ